MALTGELDLARPRALVLRALGLGDLLTAVPALRALRRGLPDHLIVLAAPSWLAPLVEVTQTVDELLPTADLEALRRCVPPPDLGVNLHGRGPQSLRALQRSGARRILTHHHPQVAGLGGPAWDQGLHEVIRWCRLVEWHGFPADPTDLRLPAPPGSENETATATERVAVVHPGAAAPSRRWPVDRFAAVARELSRRGLRVVITGSEAERALGDELARLAGLPPCAVLSGDLGLVDLARLVWSAGLVVCGDTGIAHLASAYGTASVLLFGPTSPARWGPPTGPHRVLWTGTEGDPHADVIDPGLATIQVADVVKAIDALPALSTAGTRTR